MVNWPDPPTTRRPTSRWLWLPGTGKPAFDVPMDSEVTFAAVMALTTAG
jgi:hypothetical protein